MRRAAVVLLLVLLAGCAQRPGGGTGQPAGGGTLTGGGTPAPSATATSHDPDHPRDPAHGRYLTLHGTVRTTERSGCRLLHTADGTFALYGDGTAALSDGRRITVRGAVASGPDRCAPAVPLRVVAILR